MLQSLWSSEHLTHLPQAPWGGPECLLPSCSLAGPRPWWEVLRGSLSDPGSRQQGPGDLEPAWWLCPHLLHLLRSPGNWQGQAEVAPVAPAPRLLPGWDAGLSQGSPQSPAGPFLGPWGPSGDGDATQSSAPECCPQRCSGAQGHSCMQPLPAPLPGQLPFFLSLNGQTPALSVLTCAAGESGELSPSSSGSVSGEFVHLAASGWGGV